MIPLELIRVFGELRHNKDSESNATRLFETPDVNQIMLDKIEQMARQIESLTEKVVELQKQTGTSGSQRGKERFFAVVIWEKSIELRAMGVLDDL